MLQQIIVISTMKSLVKLKLSREDAEKKGIWNSKKHTSYILYLDCNNLYGWALSQPLPIREVLNYNLNSEKLPYKPVSYTHLTLPTIYSV